MKKTKELRDVTKPVLNEEKNHEALGKTGKEDNVSQNSDLLNENDSVGNEVVSDESSINDKANSEELSKGSELVSDESSINDKVDGEELSKKEKKKNILRVIKYALIAISAGAIQIISYTLLTDVIKLDKHVSFEALYAKQPWLTEIFFDPESGKTYGLAYFIALVLSVIWNFTFNRKYTFKSANNVPFAMFLVFLYYLAFTPLSCWWLVQLNKKLSFKFADKLVLVFTMLINGVTEFLYQRFVVFRKSIDTNKQAQNEDKKKHK